ncbi:MAG: hypothetical protein QOI38_2538 [Sphingomonadales bacterium]|jgi:hypothetical protein|nr:hypothetical protein [Sphingomonadales bacterium]
MRDPFRPAWCLCALALAGCGVSGRDCSLPARLEAHAAERAAFRRALGPVVYSIPCPSTRPEILIPEENRVSAYRMRLLQRMRASELGGDVADVERRAFDADTVAVDCLGTRWTGEEHVRAGRASLAREERELRAIEARFEDLARRVAAC